MTSLRYLILISSIFNHFSSGLETCTSSYGSFPCKWSVNNYQLDLTPFQFMGINLTLSDTNGNDYYFTPCNNLLLVNSNNWEYMAISVNLIEATPLAKYNAITSPVIRFDENEQIIWNFQYNTNFSVEFICDYDLSSKLMEFTQVLEVFPNSFLFRISSYYVCDNVTVSNDLARDQCIWNDDATSQVLDLRSLYGTRMLSSDTLYRMYVCQNAYYTGSSRTCAMAMLDGRITSGMFDYSIQPDFDPVKNEWVFEYKSKGSKTYTVHWICDPNIDTYSIVSASEGGMSIATIYACAQEARCIFNDPTDNEVLDLSNLAGEDMRYLDGNLEYSFEYTVCRNDLICNDDTSAAVMAMRWNINQRICDPYLAIWNGFNGYDLSHDDGLQQWKFSYYNGEICQQTQMNTTFNIYWTCNETVANWTVTGVDTISDCDYAMYIDSVYAC